MSRRRDDCQLVLTELKQIDAGPRRWVSDDSDVGRAQDDVVVDLVAAPVAQAHVHLGMHLEQILLDALQLVQADGVDG